MDDLFTNWDGCQSIDSPFPSGIDDRTLVEVVFRNGQVHNGPAQTFGWAHSGYHPETQIVSYRILDNN